MAKLYMKNTDALVIEWIELANQDLMAVKLLVESNTNSPNAICYLCQLSAEKLLKAWLIKLGFEINKELKSHDLLKLLTVIDNKNSVSHDLFLWCSDLQDIAREPRYPSFYGRQNMLEAKESFELLSKIHSYILPILQP